MNELVQQLNEWAGPWAEAMGRASWQGGLAIAVVWLLCLTLPKIPARARCWLWRLALAKCLVCLVWTGPIRIALLPARKPTPAMAQQIQTPPAWVAPAREIPAQVAGRARTQAAPRGLRLNLPSAVLVVWFLGVMGGLAGLALQWSSARRLLRNSQRLVNRERIADDCLELAKRSGVRLVPGVRVAPDLRGPLVTGLWRPVILVPQSLLPEQHAEQLRMMLAHEVAHVKRGDLGWSWLATLTRLLFFFHPLVWLAKKESRLADEMAADELAVAVGRVRPFDYAEMLLSAAAKRLSPEREELALGIFGSGHTLKRRLQAMKYIRPGAKREMAFAAMAVISIGVSVIVPWRLVAREPTAAQSQVAAGRLQPAGDSDEKTIVVDREGQYQCQGQLMKLDEIAAKFHRAAARDPEINILIRADEGSSYRLVAALLETLYKTGVTQISLRIREQSQIAASSVSTSLSAERASDTSPAKPLAEWSFANIDGDLVPDLSGNGYNARIYDQPRQFVFGGHRHALEFNGEGNNAFWNAGTQDCGLGVTKRLNRAFEQLSVEAWVRKDAAGWMPVVSRDKWDDPYGFGLYTEWSSGKVVFGHYDPGIGHNSGVQSETIVQDGRWHHVVGTMQPACGTGYVYRIYVDGLLDAEQTGAWGVEAAPKQAGFLKIAYPNSSGADNPYRGALADIAIYQVALTPAQVKARFEAGGGTVKTETLKR